MTNQKSTTPGWQTSEFFITCLVIVCATALRLTQNIDADAWMTAVGASGLAYPISRGLTKKNEGG